MSNHQESAKGTGCLQRLTPADDSTGIHEMPVDGVSGAADGVSIPDRQLLRVTQRSGNALSESDPTPCSAEFSLMSSSDIVWISPG